MIDGCGRNIDYIRISLTDRCNMRCSYCMPPEGVDWVSHDEIMRLEEVALLAGYMAQLGIGKVKLTGGEPLLRKGCEDLVEMLKETPGIENVTLTTNGVLLADKAERLAAAGLDGINISLDSLDPVYFRKITRTDALDLVKAGIEKVLTFEGLRVKVNCVPLDQTEEELWNLAELARDRELHVRFIEMMPIGLGKNFRYRGEKEIVEILERRFGKLDPQLASLGNGPCRYYKVEGFKGQIGFISAMSHKFCDSCNRIRLTSTGMLKTCLQYEGGRELLGLLRNGASEEEILEAIEKAILQKPEAHHFQIRDMGGARLDESRIMAQIGG